MIHLRSGRRRRTSRSRARLVAALALLLPVGLVGAGCGGDSGGGSDTGATTAATTTAAGGALDGLSADDVLAKAKAAAAAATSVRIVGEGTTDGQKIGLDLLVVADDGGQGTITLDGATFDVVIKGDDVYLKAQESFFEKTLGAQYTPQVAAIIGGKYLKGPASDPNLGGFANFGNLPALVNELLSPDGAIERTDGKDIGGVPTVGLKDTDPKEGGVLYVADDGSNLPLAVEPGGGTNTGQIRFEDWNAGGSITVPAADEIVDVAALGR